jgi:hypothetical protein
MLKCQFAVDVQGVLETHGTFTSGSQLCLTLYTSGKPKQLSLCYGRLPEVRSQGSFGRPSQFLRGLYTAGQIHLAQSKRQAPIGR